MSQLAKKRDLTIGPVSRTLLFLALPLVLTNVMQMVYNFTDLFWLGRLPGNAAEAFSVIGNTVNFSWFIAAASAALTMAGASLMGQYTGANNDEGVKGVFGQLVLIVGCSLLFFISLSLYGFEGFLIWLETPEEILVATNRYLQITIPSMAAGFLFGLYQSVAHARGETTIPMIIQLVGVVVNMVLDPILIFGYLGAPALGIEGAAWATLTGRVLTALISLGVMWLSYRPLIPNKWCYYKINVVIFKRIFKIAVPQALSGSVTSFGFVLLQKFVNFYGVSVIAVYQMSNQFISLFLIPAMGVNNALGPFIAQNIGADQKERAVQAVNSGMRWVLFIMGIGTLVLFFFPAECTALLIDDPEVIELSIPMFKILSVSAFICSAMFIWMSAFSGTGHTKPLMVINISRLWLCRVPFTFLLSGWVLVHPTVSVSIWGQWAQHFQGFFELCAAPLAAAPHEALWWASLLSNIVTTFWTWWLFRKGDWQHKTIVD